MSYRKGTNQFLSLPEGGQVDYVAQYIFAVGMGWFRSFE